MTAPQMDSHKLSVKFFAEDAPGVAADAFVPVFHSWIREGSVPDHLLIDVADYAHVPEGPGTLLVAHEANIHMDEADGRLGLLYFRKQPTADGDLAGRLRTIFRAALHACTLIENDSTLGGRVRFRTDEVVFRVHDRLLAPNTPQTFESVGPELARFVSDLYGGPAKSEYRPDPERLFEIRITAPAPQNVKVLLGRL